MQLIESNNAQNPSLQEVKITNLLIFVSTRIS